MFKASLLLTCMYNQ